MPVILVVAPIAWGFSLGVSALAALITTPAVIGTELLIQKMRNPSKRTLSQEERESLKRQNALLKERRTAAETIAEMTLQNAEKAAKERDALIEDQLNATSMLVDATQEVTQTATILAKVYEKSCERDASFNAGMVEQVAQLKDTTQHIPANMTLLSDELKEKQRMIESLHIKLSELQRESAARESTLENIVHQVAELTSQNLTQATTIETLLNQKATLLATITELTEELEFLTSHQIKQNRDTTTSTEAGPACAAPTFFR